jgi:hemolysin activation/secretion protein
MKHTAQFKRPALALLILGGALHATQAQTPPPPDAGRVLRENQAPPLQPPRPGITVPIQTPAEPAAAAGGAQVELRAVAFTGNSLFDTGLLQGLVQPYIGRKLDLAGLREMAQQVTEHYRRAGYVFSRAYLLPQTINDGVVALGILEGRYGELSATGDAALAPQAQAFLVPLQVGAPIEVSRLERRLLILSDQPGIRITPLIRPGQATGQGDLQVAVERSKPWRLDLSLDNHGDRYTGRVRLRANAQYDSPFTLGDQLSASLIRSDEQLTQGSLGYGLPLGVSGLRAQLSFARTSYQLAREFSELDATGTAQVAAATLSYPLIRSTRANLSVSGSLQHKRLRDRQGLAGLDDRKSSRSATLSFQFDRSDELAGGGVSYGALSLSAGQLRLSETQDLLDQLSGVRTGGVFTKALLDLVRLQSFKHSPLSLMGRLTLQTADRNLDSSEKFSLGGPTGVRAYPLSEGIGDEGALLQMELRYAVQAWTPYAFLDAGSVRLNARPQGLAVPPQSNQRSLAGAGLGVRYQQQGWTLDLAMARSVQGGPPQAEPNSSRGRAWLLLGRQF